MKKLLSFLYEKSYYIAFWTAFLLVISRSGGYIFLYSFFGLLLILGVSLKVKPHRLNIKHYLTSTFILFSIVILAVLFSETLYDTTKVLGRSIAYMLVPIGFLFLPKKSIHTYKNGLFRGLIFGSLTTSLILLSANFIKFFNQNDGYGILSYYYTYHEFTAFINKHPTFLGFEILFGLFLLLTLLKKQNQTKKILLMFAGVILLITTLIFINSRAIIFLMLMVLFGFGIQKFYQLYKNKKYKSLALGFLGVIILSLGVYQNIKQTYFMERFSKELKWDLSYQAGTSIFFSDQGDSRFARWNSAFKVIENKPFTGYGNNSEVRELVKQYEKDNLEFALKNKYHSHNVYLSYLIEYGIWGFAFLMIFLVSNFVLAVKNKNLKWMVFTAFVCFVSVFDIYLSRSGGILMTALFINTFVFSNSYFSKENAKVDKI